MEFSINDEHLENYISSTSLNERRYTLQEECAELIQELSKVNRYQSNPIRICEEMTHVLICLYSVAKDIGIEQSNIDWQVKLKEEKENG